MPLNKKIRELLDTFAKGRVFGYGDLVGIGLNHTQLSTEIGNMVRRGELKRVMNGRFTLPDENLPIVMSASDIIKALCVYRNKVAGYETGDSIWEQWGLLPKESDRRVYYVSTMHMRPAQQHHEFLIRFRRARLDPSQYNPEILLFLDAIEAVNRITPESGSEKYFNALSEKFGNWPESNREQLGVYALSYRPATRALCGALLQKWGYLNSSWRLAASLHPASTYKICVDERWLCEHAKQWKIICVSPNECDEGKQI